MRNKMKLNNVSIIRVFATLLVILGHSTYVFTNNWTIKISTQSDFFNILTKYIYSFHMPLFVFISGFLFYYTTSEFNKRSNPKEFIKNKILRLGIPYLFIAVFYLVPILWRIGYYKLDSKTANMSIIQILIKKIFTVRGAEHLWFVFMLLGVSIIFYFIEKYLNKNKKISMLILLIISIISFKFPTYFVFSYILFYLFYYYLGYLVRQNNNRIEKICNKKNIFVIFLLHIIIFGISCNITNIYVYQLLRPIMAILGITLFMLIGEKLKYLGDKKIIDILDKNSFALYLFHVPIIYAILMKLALINISPILIVLLCFIISTLVSLILAIVFRELRLGVLIGEKMKKKK